MASAPVLLLHGFTQTSVSWRPVIERLGPDLDALAPDAPGHGAGDALRLDLAGAADRLAATIETKFPDRAPIVVGYSMGGRTALRLAFDHPSLVGGLVLLGATAGIDDAAERSARRAADEQLAQAIERDGVDQFLERWLAQPLFAGLTPEPDDLAARRSNGAAGLASSLRLTGTGTMDPPWWPDLGAIRVPTIVLFGERDAKFAVIGDRLATAIGPNATPAAIPGAGHAAHLEQPGLVAQAISSLAARLPHR